MTHTYTWFYRRLRSMTPAEVLFRAGQYVQKKKDRRRVGWQPAVRLAQLPCPLLPFDPAGTPAVNFSPEQPVFRHTININEPVDWHLDVSSGLRFPTTYAKDIDVRSGRCGSAKYAWEINRLLFGPQLAVQYRQTGDAPYLNRFVDLTRSWIRENLYLTGVNWYSNIEVNIRLINWFVAWNILDASALAEQDADFRAFVENEWVPSIYQHCVFSHANPSRHSSANNHLIAEYSGLYVAARFWDFPESAGWRAEAKAGLEREIQAQHGPNGINREEAAEYIQFITDFFLIPLVVGERAGDSFSADYAGTLKRVLHYVANMLDCRGNFPRYGDEDDGRVLLLDDAHPFNNFQSLLASGAVLFNEPLFKQRSNGFDLKNYVLFGDAGRRAFDTLLTTHHRLGSVFYPEEGHYIFRKQDAPGLASEPREIYVHADAAPLGYLSIAAHGHADALSFLMQVDGCAFLADTGTYSYQTDPLWRNYFVGTRAHNTVCIDGQNQAFQGGALLWLDHYVATVLDAKTGSLTDALTATHNGYARLRCRHTRRFRFDKADDQLLIDDVVANEGRQPRLVEVLFHLGPAVRVEHLSRNTFVLTHPGTDRRVCLSVALNLKTELVSGRTEPTPLGWCSEGFYRKQPSITIRAFATLDANRTIKLAHRLDIQDGPPPRRPGQPAHQYVSQPI